MGRLTDVISVLCWTICVVGLLMAALALIAPAGAISISISSSPGTDTETSGFDSLGPNDTFTLNGVLVDGRKEWDDGTSSFWEVWWNGLLVEKGEVNHKTDIGYVTMIDYAPSCLGNCSPIGGN